MAAGFINGNVRMLQPATAGIITESLFTRFINYLDASPKTVETYTKAVRQLFRYLMERSITRPQRADILSYRDALKVNHKPATVQNYILAARLFFQWTEQEGLYPNVANHIKGAKLTREHKKDYLTVSQVKNVLQAIERNTEEGKRDYAMLALMITGGLRTIEVSRANVEDLRPLGNFMVLYLQGKGRDERTDYVKLPEMVEKAIRTYLAERRNTDGKEALFTSRSNNSKGNRLSTRTVSGIAKKRMQAVGYDSERLTAHSLRHTAVTLSLLGGNTLQEVQQFARHTNITTTQIYAHNLDREKIQCENTIAKAIF